MRLKFHRHRLSGRAYGLNPQEQTMDNTSLIVEKDKVRHTEIVDLPVVPLQDGDVLLKVDKFGFTANNVTYAVLGERIGYWQFFPVADRPDWFRVPVWGFADVVESNSGNVEVGQRIFGYLPMSEYLMVQPESVTEHGFTDASSHRKDLPMVYNQYSIVTKGSGNISEEERAILSPVFGTSFLLSDFLADNDYFGATTVLIGSASSKTGLGLAQLLSGDNSPVRVSGITGVRNKAFVTSLGTYDRVATYDDLRSFDTSERTMFVDMAGSGKVIEEVHEIYGDNLAFSSIVGVTHWEAGRPPKNLPGPKPTMFFGPGQVEKRYKELGAEEYRTRAAAATDQLYQSSRNWLKIERRTGGSAVAETYLSVVDGKTPADTAYMFSMSAG